MLLYKGFYFNNKTFCLSLCVYFCFLKISITILNPLVFWKVISASSTETFSFGLGLWCPQAALLSKVPFDGVTLSRKTRVLGKSSVVFLYCSQGLATIIKYLLNVFHALSFLDYKKGNIQKTETLELGMVVHGIPVHTRLEQEDCKSEASLKIKSPYYFLEKILF